MLEYLTNALSASDDAIQALVAVGGKLPRECVVSAADDIGLVLRWSALPETYLFPWSRIEAVVLKSA